MRVRILRRISSSFLRKRTNWSCCLLRGLLTVPMSGAEIGAAWGRRIPIVALLLGITATELQMRLGIPVLLKKRDLIDLNDVEVYLGQLGERVRQEKG